MDSTDVPPPVVSTVADAQSQKTTPDAPSPAKKSSRKGSSSSKPKAATKEVEGNQQLAPKKRQTSKKTQKAVAQAQETSPNVDGQVGDSPSPESPPEEPTPPKKKRSRRVGQRKPQRDPVG